MTDESWTPEAITILEGSIRRHGGLYAWRRLRRISLTPTRLWGALPWLKGAGRTFPLPATIEVSPHERRTVFYDYPMRGQRGVFDRGAVRIESTEDGLALQALSDPRSSFDGWSKNRRWTPMDALYFFGYALWHYHTIPFTLGEARLLRATRARMDGEALCGLEVVFPGDVPTHSLRQTFYFDESGLVRRHDYVAEIIGAWAHGAHIWSAYQFVAGIPIATERRVYPHRFGRTLPLNALRATFTNIHVELDAPAGDP